MKPTVLLLLLISVLAWATVAAQSKDRLSLSSSSGKAPFTVRITGPGGLMKLGHGQTQKWVGCGYRVFWGDGPQSYSPGARLGSDCSGGFEHTYQKPGAYTLKASIWHPGPNDAPITTWSDSAAITVSKDQ